MPLATFTVNMVGSLLLGIFIGYYLARQQEPNIARLVFAVGFCGSFTTFSTFAYENWTLITDHNFGSFAGYTMASILLGLLMIFGGIALGKAI